MELPKPLGTPAKRLELQLRALGNCFGLWVVSTGLKQFGNLEARTGSSLDSWLEEEGSCWSSGCEETCCLGLEFRVQLSGDLGFQIKTNWGLYVPSFWS